MTLKVDVVENTSGGAVTLTNQSAAKAWGNYTNSGTFTTNDSFNVSSTNDLAVGALTPSFTNSFDSANFATATAGEKSASYHCILHGYSNPTASTTNVVTGSGTNSALDVEFVSFISCGDLA